MNAVHKNWCHIYRLNEMVEKNLATLLEKINLYHDNARAVDITNIKNNIDIENVFCSCHILR